MNLHLARRPDDRDRPTEDGTDAGGLSLLRHLEELRRRIVYAAIAIAVGMLVAFAFITPIFDFVFRPIRSVLPPGSKLIYTQPGEAFSVYVQIALIAGIVFASPFVMYQVWRLIAPALYQKQHKRFAAAVRPADEPRLHRRRALQPLHRLPVDDRVLRQLQYGNLAFMPKLDDVFGLYTKMLFGMGLVFQMPAVVFFLAKMGLVTARFLLVNFKYAVLLIFIAAAVITPSGDAATQALFAAPMVGLYLIGIVIAWIVGPVAREAQPGVAAERSQRHVSKERHGNANLRDPPSQSEADRRRLSVPGRSRPSPSRLRWFDIGGRAHVRGRAGVADGVESRPARHQPLYTTKLQDRIIRLEMRIRVRAAALAGAAGGSRACHRRRSSRCALHPTRSCRHSWSGPSATSHRRPDQARDHELGPRFGSDLRSG